MHHKDYLLKRLPEDVAAHKDYRLKKVQLMHFLWHFLKYQP